MTIWASNMTRRSKINYSKIKITFFLLVIGGFFIWSNFCFGATNDLVINEITWMGTNLSSADEWLELYNNTSQEIDLTGWTLKASDGTPEITLEGIIAAQGYFLLERTDDNSVPAIIADQIYTGALSNSGENLELRDGENNLIDQVDCSEGWLAGDNNSKQTMEKADSGWQTSLDRDGTPKAQNSKGQEIQPEEPSEPTEEPEVEGWIPPTVVNQPPRAEAGPDITALVSQEISFEASQSSDPDNDVLTYFWNFGDGATETEEKTKHIYLYPGQYIVTLMVSDGEFSDLDIIMVNIYSPSVIISEFVPNQWIEIFNQSKQMANLTGWQLNDFVFPANSLIASEQFLVLALNNEQDQVRLLYPDGSLATEVSYFEEKEQGLSVAFDGQDYFWTKIPTPGLVNIISNLSSQNLQPITKETQELPEISAKINLNQGQEFPALSPS